MNIKRFWELAVHFFFPVSCENCGKPGKSLCDECRLKMEITELINNAIEQAIPRITAKVLQELGNRVTEQKQPDDDEYLSLFEDKPIIKNMKDVTVYSAAVFYSQIRPLIHDFKYSGKKSLCARLGRAMGKFFVQPDADYIVPVPLHLNSPRGYNQSAELAKSIAEVWHVEVLDTVKWSRDVSDRVGLSGEERKQLTPDVFRVTQEVQGLRVVIVDDVCTTGATLSCMAGALREAGAVVVRAYTLAATGI